MLVAVLITVPTWIGPPLSHQSFWIDVVWQDQFTDQLGEGIAYPRWLPDSHNGLGSPVFYYYPPLAFYLGAIPNILGFSDYSSIIITFGIAAAASGATMYWWLQSTRQPLIGSIAFMLLPYHQFDFYYRGALAEYLGIAFLPLIAIGLNRRPVILALAYGGLIMTHLPLALLASLFLIIPYGSYIVWRDRTMLRSIAVGLFCGLCLSAIYLYPALSLEEFRKVDELYRSPLFDTTAWNFFRPERWSSVSTIQHIILMTSALLIGALILIKRGFWPLLAILIGLIVSGAVDVWSLPLLAKVQFPFRALPIMEFALATAFAHTARGVIAPLAIAPALVLSTTIRDAEVGTVLPLEYYTQTHRDVPEYLPARVPGGKIDYMEWAQEVSKVRPNSTFYFPSLGNTTDGVFVAGPIDRRTLPAEWIGLVLSLFGLFLLSIIGRLKFPETTRQGDADVVGEPNFGPRTE